MSGWVALLNLDGAPVDDAALGRLTDTLRFRGPDAREIWCAGQAGLGHTWLRTASGERVEGQPTSLDGAVWLTGDVRVDGRGELVRRLAAAGEAPDAQATDASLILHAYRAWGEALLDHLLGDFSFAIWDAPRRRLFCARDQFGVRPFFYAMAGRQLVASNTLACLRAHPGLSTDLNDAAIGDFLLFGFNADPCTTSFKDIRRLPGGHKLSWSPGSEMLITRYWSLPRFEELKLPRHGEYIERFRAILTEAVADRLRTDHAVVQMSGGLDSTLIAATARTLMAKGEPVGQLSAQTVVYDYLFRDEERYFATLAAEWIDVPIHHLAADDFGLFDRGDASTALFAEPLDALARPSFFDAAARLNHPQARIVLSGYDGDAVLSASWSQQMKGEARRGNLGGVATNIWGYIRAKQDLGSAILRRLPGGGRRKVSEPVFPVWLEPGFVQRNGLRERWDCAAAPRSLSGARSSAYWSMTQPGWLPLLEAADAGNTGVPVEQRYPLLDLRLVEYCLSLPAIPWCVDKNIMREAGRGLLPEPVRTRPKSPLGGEPMPFAIRRYLRSLNGPPRLHPAMGRYIEPNFLPRIIDEAGTEAYWLALRVLVLNFWLFSKGSFNGRSDGHGEREASV